jgi:hypothetical protein
MSDTYLEFFFTVDLPNEGVVGEVNGLIELVDRYENSADADARADLAKMIGEVFSEFEEYEEIGFDMTIDNHLDTPRLFCQSGSNGNTEHAANLLVWLLPKVNHKALGFTYSVHGDEHDGGAIAVVMTKEGPEASWTSGMEWLAKKLG